MSDRGRGRCEVESARLQRREHLTLLLTIQQAVVVLHRDERREVVRDRVVCGDKFGSVKTIVAEANARTYFAWRGLRKRTRVS